METSNPALEAARIGAGSIPPPMNPKPDPAKEGGNKQEPPPIPTPPPTPDSVVALAEMVTLLAVKSFCAVNNVEINKEIESLCLLTPQEKKQLESVAPFAMPFIMKMLQNLPVLGACAFFGLYALILARRYATIKKYIKPKEEIKDLGKVKESGKD